MLRSEYHQGNVLIDVEARVSFTRSEAADGSSRIVQSILTYEPPGAFRSQEDSD